MVGFTEVSWWFSCLFGFCVTGFLSRARSWRLCASPGHSSCECSYYVPFLAKTSSTASEVLLEDEECIGCLEQGGCKGQVAEQSFSACSKICVIPGEKKVRLRFHRPSHSFASLRLWRPRQSNIPSINVHLLLTRSPYPEAAFLDWNLMA